MGAGGEDAAALSDERLRAHAERLVEVPGVVGVVVGRTASSRSSGPTRTLSVERSPRRTPSSTRYPPPDPCAAAGPDQPQTHETLAPDPRIGLRGVGSQRFAVLLGPAGALRAQRPWMISRISWAVSLGVFPTLTPAASRASFLPAAVPAPPDTIAPAWPMVLPSGAVNPAT